MLIALLFSIDTVSLDRTHSGNNHLQRSTDQRLSDPLYSSADINEQFATQNQYSIVQQRGPLALERFDLGPEYSEPVTNAEEEDAMYAALWTSTVSIHFDMIG